MSPHFSFSATLALSTTLTSLLLAVGCQSPTPATDTATTAEVPSSLTTSSVAAAAASTTAAPAAVATSPAAVSEEQPAAEEKTATGKPSNVAKSDAKDTKPPATVTTPAAVTTPTAGTPKPEEAAVEKPCLATSFRFPAVQAACKKGGVPKAKSLMKAWTNQAKERGESYKCTTCHDNQRTYSNKPNAEDDLRKLLAIIK